MSRVPFNLKSVRAARDLRAGTTDDIVCGSHGLTKSGVRRIAETYQDVPDSLLLRFESVLTDRERLRHVIATLLANRLPD